MQKKTAEQKESAVSSLTRSSDSKEKMKAETDASGTPHHRHFYQLIQGVSVLFVVFQCYLANAQGILSSGIIIIIIIQMQLLLKKIINVIIIGCCYVSSISLLNLSKK